MCGGMISWRCFRERCFGGRGVRYWRVRWVGRGQFGYQCIVSIRYPWWKLMRYYYFKSLSMEFTIKLIKILWASSITQIARLFNPYHAREPTQGRWLPAPEKDNFSCIVIQVRVILIWRICAIFGRCLGIRMESIGLEFIDYLILKLFYWDGVQN